MAQHEPWRIERHQTFLQKNRPGTVAVAVPVRDEEDRLEACLDALDRQVCGRADHIVVLLNNCTDRSAEIARGMRSRLNSTLHVIEMLLPPERANAGHARRLAMNQAARRAGAAGVILTTDADGRVDPEWVGANLAALHAGADAVAGWVELDPQDWGAIPMALHEADALECGYDSACDALHAGLDPDPDDPWPRHTQASGASLAVTVAAYRAAGGLPAVPCGEDRAFVTALRQIDARVRHAPECRVVVSGRLAGRAVGGMADTIRRRLVTPDRFLDDRLEPARACAFRAALRHLARDVYRRGRGLEGLQRASGLDGAVLSGLLERPHFGTAWAAIEATSPRLRRERVLASDVTRQQKVADELLARVRQNAQACRAETIEYCQDGGTVLGMVGCQSASHPTA